MSAGLYHPGAGLPETSRLASQLSGLATPPLPSIPRCEVCERAAAAGEPRCRNPLCASASRWFGWNVAVAERGGPLEAALNAYKYGCDRRLARAFASMLAALINGNRRMAGFDLVVASPTYVGARARSFDHTRLILTEAAEMVSADVARHLDLASVPALVKTGPTPRLAGLGHHRRRQVAEELLRPRLRVADPRRISGLRVLVFDDVFTDGCTLNECARALRLQGGAREVCGVSLCRQPWREREVAPARPLRLPSSSRSQNAENVPGHPRHRPPRA